MEKSKKLKKSTLCGIICYIIFCTIILISFYQHIDNAFNYTTPKVNSSEVIVLENNVHYKTPIKNFNDPIKEFSVQFGTYHRINHGTLFIDLLNDKGVLYSSSFLLHNLIDNELQIFSFEKPLKMKKGEKYFLDIHVEYDTPKDGIAVYISPSGMSISSEEQEYEYKTFYTQWTLGNQVAKSKYFPLYLGIMFLLLLTNGLFFLDFSKINIPILFFVMITILCIFRLFDYELFQNFRTNITVGERYYFDRPVPIAAGESVDGTISVKNNPFNVIKLFIDSFTKNEIIVELSNLNDDNFLSKTVEKTDLIADSQSNKIAAVIELPATPN